MSLLVISHLRKSFGGAVALKDASLELQAGETLGLMGENGAGKSTLIKILAGAVAPDGGEIRLDDVPATLRGPGEAHRLGLRFIHQELNIVAALSVAENIFLGRDYPRRFGLINWRLLDARAHTSLATLGVEHIAPKTIMAKLSVGDRMLVKIAAAFLEEEEDAPAAHIRHGRADGGTERRGVCSAYSALSRHSAAEAVEFCMFRTAWTRYCR